MHNKTFNFEAAYMRLFRNIFNPILDRFNYPEEDRKYVMMYYLNGINAIIFEWLKDDCVKSIEEISRIITICIYGLRRD
ncbi:MAG: TetR-like C-terminal domain-containing protein [Acutalibacteraceae bacterium]|nr:TetR-like C-terminal domain-containing protein [Acutalibacteraceae bacterium]